MRNKKKLVALGLAAALICSGLPIQGIGMTNVFAQEQATEEFTIDENGVLTKYNGAGGDVVIPDGVTSIGENAFCYCDELTSVTIPQSVTYICNYAFEGCSSLTSVTIPQSVAYIGYFAFADCSGLTGITIPESVTSIEFSAFRGCSGLKRITVDKDNSVYDSREGCNAIIETEKNRLVVGCSNTVIPNSVTSVYHCAFEGCSNLANIIIPEGVTGIGGAAFSDCSGLIYITIPKSVEWINKLEGSGYTVEGHEVSMLEGCSSLASITVADGNNKYDSREGCNAIIETESNKLIAGCKNTVIPEGVTEIGSNAFSGCSGLVSIKIPKGVTYIGDNAFENCSGLTNITVPESVTEIGSTAFSGCSGLTSITIPESVTAIGNKVFDGCSGLTSIIIPEGVTNIGDSAFRHCSGLTSITIPEGVTNIGYETFADCSSLASVTVPKNVTSIGQGAFRDCSGLTSITIPEGVTSIGYGAFSRCSSLINITIPKSVTAIGNRAFDFCSGLTSITIPKSVTAIGDEVFDGCSGLTSITVDKNNSKYDSREDCNAIIETESNTLIAGCKNTIIPEGVTNIGDRAFYCCSGLTSITIPESVTEIGDFAFFASALKTIKGKKGSYAETYANEKGYKFVDIEDENTGDDTSAGYRELTKCNFKADMTVEEGVATVTISLNGDCSVFDFGLMYDADTMEYADGDMTYDFSNEFSKKAAGISQIAAQKNLSYIVCAGKGDDCTFNGEALIVKFNIKGDEATPIYILKDSKYVFDAYYASEATGTLEEFLASDKAPADAPKAVKVTPSVSDPGEGGDVTGPSGDVTGPSGDVTGPSGDVTGPSGDVTGPSGNTDDAAFLAGDVDCNKEVNLNDATIVLRIAVGIQPQSSVIKQGQKNADYDKSGKIDLKDATYTLKAAVGIKFMLPKV